MLKIHCYKRLVEAYAFADAHGIASQLEEKLAYLGNYAHDLEDLDPTHRLPVRCVLDTDFAPLSFRFTVERYTEGTPGIDGTPSWWKPVLSGGLIYQGPDQPADGGAPSFTVSLAEGTGWFVHT